MLNSFRIFIGRNRWIKRPLLKFGLAPSEAHLDFKAGKLKRLFIDAQDLYGPSYDVMFGGFNSYQNYELSEKKALLSALPSDGVFFDIGANIGLFSFYFSEAMPNARIFSFEPHPPTFKKLDATKRFSKFENINIYPLALGEKTEDRSFFENATNAGGHTLVKEIFSPDEVVAKTHRVQMISLDDFVEREKIERIDVMKIDVQGFEKNVLKGGMRTLEKFRPLILIECDHPQNLKDNYIEEIFSPLNYKFSLVGETTRHPLSQIRALAQSELALKRVQSNLLLIP